MGRLIDDILADGFFHGKTECKWPDSFMPEIFLIQNVADYFYDQCPTLKGNEPGESYKVVSSRWTLGDFPNLAPPFPAYWMEYELRRDWPCAGTVRRVGVMCEGQPVPLDSRALLTGTPIRKIGVDYLKDSVEVTTDTVWMTSYALYVETTRGKALEVERVFLPLNRLGEITVTVESPLPVLLVQCPTDRVPNDSEYLADVAKLWIYPAWLATSFLHCHNVAITETAPHPKLARKYQKRTGRSPVSFKTLEIHATRKMLTRSGANGTETGLKKALHICRGSFGHYGSAYVNDDGSPKGKLFGKVEGMFWRPASLKGNSSEGAVVKDYAVSQ